MSLVPFRDNVHQLVESALARARRVAAVVRLRFTILWISNSRFRFAVRVAVGSVVSGSYIGCLWYLFGEENAPTVLFATDVLLLYIARHQIFVEGVRCMFPFLPSSLQRNLALRGIQNFNEFTHSLPTNMESQLDGYVIPFNLQYGSLVDSKSLVLNFSVGDMFRVLPFLKEIKDLQELHVYVNTVHQLVCVAEHLEVGMINRLGIHILFPLNTFDSYEIFSSLVRIPRNRFLVHELVSSRSSHIQPIIQAISRGLEQIETSGLGMPMLEFRGVGPSFQNQLGSSLLVQGNISSLSVRCNPGEEDDTLVFVSGLLRSNNVKLEKLGVIVDSLNRRIPEPAVQSFGAALKVNTSLQELHMGYIDINKNLHFILDGINSSMQTNKSLCHLRLGIHVNSIDEWTQHRFAVLWDAFATAIEDVNLESFTVHVILEQQLKCRCMPESSFISRFWSNESLVTCRFLVSNSMMAIGETLDLARLVLRNKLLKSAKSWVLSDPNNGKAEFLNKLAEINETRDDPNDVHDVNISALFEVTRKNLPQLMTSMITGPPCLDELAKKASTPKNKGEGLRSSYVSILVYLEDIRTKRYGLATLIGLTTIALGLDPRV